MREGSRSPTSKDKANDSWASILSAKRLNDAEVLMSQRKARNEAIDLAYCLQICDKLKIVCHVEEIRNYLKSKFGKVSEFTKAIESLRNKLAHANDLVTGSTWVEIIDLGQNMEESLDFLERF
jgi:hypothetical protein